MLTPIQQKYYAWDISHKKSVTDDSRFTGVLSEARVDLNPHQVEAALFAFKSPLSKGAILADEVGLGKTIEAGIILSEMWAENKRDIIIVVPASLRNQWNIELMEKFYLPSFILDKNSFQEGVELNKRGEKTIYICSYNFAVTYHERLKSIDWDLIVMDEAHKLRNVYKKSNVMANIIRATFRNYKKVLLTATPLQNNLKELYGLISIIDPEYFSSLDTFAEQYNAISTRDKAKYGELKGRISHIIHRTLRNQVQEYVNFTKRTAFVQEYTPSAKETKLYELITEYLHREGTYGVPEKQRSLLTLLVTKILSSSSYALSFTLDRFIERLKMYKDTGKMTSILDNLNEDNEGSYVDDYPSEENVYDFKSCDDIDDEIRELIGYRNLAQSISKESKAIQLLKALTISFERIENLGGNRKALIFTESRRTQEYLFNFLENNGYKDKVVCFNGNNDSNAAKNIYHLWLMRYAGTNRISGSAVIDKKQSIVDAFKDDAEILIATEAGAEGINLQFCSLVVNYDMPWNPQRIEQRIGRCHRYGQKNDVVVVNFVNQSNRADCRVYELLNNKFSFSAEDLKMIVAVLIDKTIDASVVMNMLTQYVPKPEDCAFRHGNGVDIDMESLVNYYRESMYQAYLDDKLTCPTVSRYYYSYKSWEKYLESLVARTAYIMGVLYRKRAAKEDYTSHYALVKETLDSIDFTFDMRSNWERSYLLPEDIMPIIYDRLAEIYRDFFEDKIDDFKSHLQYRIPDQLSLYREGCCAVLISLIRIFRMNDSMRQLALYLADEAVKYVVYAVQNRSERCTCLLQICLEYALLNKVEKANEIYKEVLNSSMGPNWYKEGQLGLINAIRETDINFDGQQAAHVAAIFEEASGEMTFQRYVQQSKNQFTGTLVKSASLADAIAYYKFETLPTAEIIKQNAEEWKVDMPRTGDGYELGANHLIESSAICYLLRESKHVSPYIRYAISELFWENWDKMHNDRNYAELHADLLNAVGEQTAKDVLLPRMAEYFVNEYFADKKGDYLGDIEDVNISESVLKLFQSNLKGNGYKWNRKTPNPDILEHEESYSEKLRKLPSCKSMLDELRKDIVSPLGSYWYSLDQFLVALTKKPDFDKTQFLEVITSHFDVNVHPSEKQYEKFNWFVGKHEETDADEQMIHFLIWFLVHPERKVMLRSQDALKWLVKLDNRVIGCLIEEILKPSEIGLATASSAILLEIANEIPNVVYQFFQNAEVQKELSAVINFSVSRNLYEMALLFKKQCGQDDFLNLMKSVIPDSLPDRNDVMFDNNDMLFIERKIDKLNGLKVTGGREFAKPYMDALKELGGIDKMSVLIKADHYAARSFYMNVWDEGRYDRTMSGILNRVLYGKIDYKRAGSAYYAINS